MDEELSFGIQNEVGQVLVGKEEIKRYLAGYFGKVLPWRIFTGWCREHGCPGVEMRGFGWALHLDEFDQWVREFMRR